MEHNARVLERSRWHPAASGFLMQRLAVPSTTAVATARWGCEIDIFRGIQQPLVAVSTRVQTVCSPCRYLDEKKAVYRADLARRKTPDPHG